MRETVLSLSHVGSQTLITTAHFKSEVDAGKQHPPAPVDPVSHEQWCAVDDYFSERLLGADPVLDQALKNSRDNGLDDHAVAPNQGKVLWMLAKMMRARNVLEVGTLGGYRWAPLFTSGSCFKLSCQRSAVYSLCCSRPCLWPEVAQRCGHNRSLHAAWMHLLK